MQNPKRTYTLFMQIYMQNKESYANQNTNLSKFAQKSCIH